MSTVPNYIGTSSELQGTNNIEATGSNIQTKLGPKNVHYDKPVALPSLFISPLPRDRFELAQEDKEAAQVFSTTQNELFKILPDELDESWVPSTLDYPVMMDLEPTNAFNEYANTMLRHNALFNIKIMRKSNF